MATVQEPLCDCTGRELKEGDFVGFVLPSRHIQSVGRILKFSPKSIRAVELEVETDALDRVTGRIVAKVRRYGEYNQGNSKTFQHTVRPTHAVIMNETAQNWMFIPDVEFTWWDQLR